MFISIDDNERTFLDELETEPIDMEQDPFFGETPKKELNTAISIWLAGAIVFFLISVFIIGGLLIREMYYQPQQTNSAMERELIKFKNAIDKNPDNVDARIGLAGVYLQIDQPQKALSELNRAREIEPHSWNTVFGLGMVYESMGDRKNAKSCFRKTSSMNPSSELPYFKLGTIYQAEELYVAAVSEYKKALNINPTLADAHYGLGQCYEKTNRKNLAAYEYRQALKYVNNYPDAKEALQRLR